MNSLWRMTLNDYFEILKMAQANGKKPGESMQDEFDEYAKSKNLKPFTNTELNKDEILSEIVSKDKKILNIETDKKGKQKIEIVKKREDLDN